MTNEETVFLRCYVISILCMRNACRSGVITNMTLQEFKLAELIEGKWCVTIANHKTAVQGPAILILEDDIYNRMQMFMSIVHHKPAAPGELFFISQNGQDIRPCQDMTRLWHHLGIRCDKTVNCTHFHKQVATMVRLTSLCN
ncbi:uncharacterized protein LOC117120857 isoform X2 [Anneissia japonica]|uniref:uncharacterized protein LOC117120857 isoform X2 n=1 Tax=Anneissia japonica TaxID=1529436 RepID=UPI0014256D5C|nr:uncharacterized protein LOC117120857 isoform X2 [Anneissia japonica]